MAEDHVENAVSAGLQPTSAAAAAAVAPQPTTIVDVALLVVPFPDVSQHRPAGVPILPILAVPRHVDVVVPAAAAADCPRC